MQFRGGPAAVIGDEARIATVQFQLNGKGERRKTRKPEDECQVLGKLMVKATPTFEVGVFYWANIWRTQ